MSFTEAVKTCFSKYFCFTGRARRSEYWYWALFSCLLTFVVVFVVYLICGGNDDATAMKTVPAILELALFCPSLSVSVRRLHDVGKSGWYMLLNVLPLIGSIIVLIQMLKDGMPGPNQYGPSPKFKEYVDNIPYYQNKQ